MRPAAGAFLLVGLLGTCACGRTDRFLARNAPVVLISVDTLRADHLPAYGYRGVATPNLDALRKDAVLFENAYSHVPLTLPSHACLLTGLLPPENGVRDNTGYKLPPGVETLAAFLQKQRYATGAAVSSAVLSRETGIDRGFEFYDDAFGGGRMVERDGARSADILLQWLERRRREPFFVFLHLFEPHAPYEPPEPYRSRYRLAYDGEIARADEIVGMFLGRLRQWGLYDRSLIIFVSDHGEGLLDHGEREHGVFLYRETIRVPMLVKFPGAVAVKEPERISAPVGLVDIFPTVTRVLGLTSPPARAGIPLTAFLERGPVPARRVYSETLYPRLRLGWSDLASLVDDRFHFIEAPRPELYDIAADPGEKMDLSKGMPPAFRAMRAELHGKAESFELPGPADPEQARKLASLGYLSATSSRAKGRQLPDPKDHIGELDASLQFGRLLAEGRDADLIRACREFLGSNPAVLDVWRMLADALERSGRRAEAVAALQQGLRASGETALPALRAPALERLALLLARSGRLEEALALGEAESFTDPEALNAIGIAQARAGRTADARKTFERVLAMSPGNAEAHFNLGLARVGLGDEAGAIESWRRALKLDGGQYGALYNLAIAEGRRGEIGAAREKLQRFVANAPPALYAKDLAEARRLLKSMGS